MSVTTFTWLHLTDLHIGQKQYGHDSRNVRAWLLNDLTKLVERARNKGRLLRPDVVFFTGDLAYSGKEYGSGEPTNEATVESYLTELWASLPAEWQPRPLLAPVPGNHDLVWQDLSADEEILWKLFHKERPVRDQLFGSLKRRASDPSLPAFADYWLHRKLSQAFSGYTRWLGQPSAIPRVDTSATPGLLPGEYATTFVTKEGARIGILGLNSAYHDLPNLRKGRPGEHELALYPEQLNGFRGPSFAEWCDRHHACIALTHHPPSWIAGSALEQLRGGGYFSGRRIALHLSGHMHEMLSDRWGSGWNGQTLIFQGRSFFGMESSGEKDEDLLESYGYAVGQIAFTAGASNAELRMYPRRVVKEANDISFRGDVGTDEETSALSPQPITVRPWTPAAPALVEDVERASPPSLDRMPRLDAIVKGAHAILTRPGASSVFVYGPRCHGKTELAARLADALASPSVTVSRANILHIERSNDRDDADLVVRYLCEQLYLAVTGKDYEREDGDYTLTRCFSDCISAAKGPRLLVLVLESFDSMGHEANQIVQGRLRACIETHRYTSASRSGFRVVVLAGVPFDLAVPEPSESSGDAISPLAHMLEKFELGPLRLEDALALGGARLAWVRRRGLVEWLWRHTGGHPLIFTRLWKELDSLTPDAWPPWTRGTEESEALADGLHAKDGPLAQEVEEIARVVQSIAKSLKSRDPASYLPGGLCLGNAKRTAGVGLSPFVQRVLTAQPT